MVTTAVMSCQVVKFHLSFKMTQLFINLKLKKYWIFISLGSVVPSIMRVSPIRLKSDLLRALFS